MNPERIKAAEHRHHDARQRYHKQDNRRVPAFVNGQLRDQLNASSDS